MITKRFAGLSSGCALALVWCLGPGTVAASDSDDVVCLQRRFTGCLTIESVADWQADEARQRVLIDAVLRDPTAVSDDEWSELITLIELQPERRSSMIEHYRSMHWQDDSGIEMITENPRPWTRLWRDSRPNSRAAWCRWADQVSPETARRALRRALEADPHNAGARQCLVRRLVAHGELNDVREILREHPTDGISDDEWHLAWSPELPPDLQGLYQVYGALRDSEGQLETVREALRRRPGDPVLGTFLTIFDGSDDEDEARLATWIQADLPFELMTMACDHLLDDEACLDLLSDRVLAAGVHLDPESGLEPAVSFDLRAMLVERAVARDDPRLLESLLFDGPEVGRYQLWAAAADELEFLDDADSDDRQLTMKQLCDRFSTAVLGGEIDAPVLGTVAACPDRVEHVLFALRTCHDAVGEVEAGDRVREHLLERAASRFPEWSTETLLAWDEPKSAVIHELERRIESSPDPRLFDRLAEMTMDPKVDPARALAAREHLLAIDGSDSTRCRWIDALVANHPGAETKALARAIDRWPDWIDLRLHAMAASPDPIFARQQGRHVLNNPQASVRQIAEAHYHLGVRARLEGDTLRASDHFEHYFLARLRTVGCPSHWRDCDQLMLHQLGLTRDRERIVRYLAGRRQAAREHPANLHPEPPAVRALEAVIEAGCGADLPWDHSACGLSLPLDGAQKVPGLVPFCR